MKFANKIFGQNLRQFLKDAGIKQTELAEKLGVKDPTVSDWIAGKYAPEDDKVAIISKLLNRRPEAFLVVPNIPAEAELDALYERLIHAKSTLQNPSDFVYLLDVFLDAQPPIRALILALLANENRIAEPYYSGFATRRAQLLKSQ